MPEPVKETGPEPAAELPAPVPAPESVPETTTTLTPELEPNSVLAPEPAPKPSPAETSVQSAVPQQEAANEAAEEVVEEAEPELTAPEAVLEVPQAESIEPEPAQLEPAQPEPAAEPTAELPPVEISVEESASVLEESAAPLPDAAYEAVPELEIAAQLPVETASEPSAAPPVEALPELEPVPEPPAELLIRPSNESTVPHPFRRLYREMGGKLTHYLRAGSIDSELLTEPPPEQASEVLEPVEVSIPKPVALPAEPAAIEMVSIFFDAPVSLDLHALDVPDLDLPVADLPAVEEPVPPAEQPAPEAAPVEPSTPPEQLDPDPDLAPAPQPGTKSEEAEAALETMEVMEVPQNPDPAFDAENDLQQEAVVEPPTAEAHPAPSEPGADEAAAAFEPEIASDQPLTVSVETEADSQTEEIADSEPVATPDEASEPVAVAETAVELTAGEPESATEELPAPPDESVEPESAAAAESSQPENAELVASDESAADEQPGTASETQATEPVSPAPSASNEDPEGSGPTPDAEPAVETKPTHPMITREVSDDAPFAILVNQVYDGPLDLLLDLIRKQDIDIYDIPIAKITQQFLSYVNRLKATDVDTAGEFIYMASLLIHIKSKMLLPRTPTGQDDAAEDPRRELVERLLEHERFKNAAQMLLEKQMLEAASWSNPGMREFRHEDNADTEIAADTTDLVRIFRDILDRVRSRPVIDVEEDSVTVGQMIQFLSRRLTMEDKPVALRRLLSHTRSERALIAMFLALLELVRMQAILLRQDSAFSEIFIKKHSGFEAVMNQGAANLEDEWR
jgi:segregation and condensation protein A